MKIRISNYENYTIEKLILLLKQNGIKKMTNFHLNLIMMIVIMMETHSFNYY